MWMFSSTMNHMLWSLSGIVIHLKSTRLLMLKYACSSLCAVQWKYQERVMIKPFFIFFNFIESIKMKIYLHWNKLIYKLWSSLLSSTSQRMKCGMLRESLILKFSVSPSIPWKHNRKCSRILWHKYCIGNHISLYSLLGLKIPLFLPWSSQGYKSSIVVA